MKTLAPFFPTVQHELICKIFATMFFNNCILNIFRSQRARVSTPSKIQNHFSLISMDRGESHFKQTALLRKLGIKTN